MCIFFIMYDTHLRWDFISFIVQKIGQILNIQRCPMKKIEKKTLFQSSIPSIILSQGLGKRTTRWGTFCGFLKALPDPGIIVNTSRTWSEFHIFIQVFLIRLRNLNENHGTICPRSSDPFHIVSKMGQYFLGTQY